jgi:hypothetical protein
MKKSSYVVVRADTAGAFFGKLVSQDIKEGAVVLDDCRRLWYWSGAASLSELAQRGVKNPTQCKFPEATNGHMILRVAEIIPATAEAVKSIQGVPIWKA